MSSGSGCPTTGRRVCMPLVVSPLAFAGGRDTLRARATHIAGGAPEAERRGWSARPLNLIRVMPAKESERIMSNGNGKRSLPQVSESAFEKVYVEKDGLSVPFKRIRLSGG